MACNNALVFVKPHANNDAVNALVKEKLAAANFKILGEGVVTGEKMDSDKIIDQHYATLARYAVQAGADQLPVSEEVQKKFQEQFGAAWSDLVSTGTILNAKQASEKLGGITATELSDKWKANDNRMKLAPGLYVTKFEADGIYVINGFYLINREKFTKAGAAVNWYTVEWTEESMAWVDFRAKFIGPTNCAVAPEESLRGIIFRDWEKLGLAEVPNVSDNGVHASAGPIEGLNERGIWTGAKVEEDPYGKQLVEAGCDMDLVKEWLGNPIAEVNGVSQPVYDHLEDKQSSDVTAIIKNFKKSGAAAADDTTTDIPTATDDTTAVTNDETSKKEEAKKEDPAPATEEKKEEGADAAAPKEGAKRVFSDEEKKKLELIFELFDEDKSGTIDSAELPNVVRYVGYTPSEAKCAELMKRYDENNDGKISLSEFYTLCETEDIQQDTDADLQAAFEEFDQDKNGFLSKKELVEALTTFGEPMSEKEIEAMFEGIDINGDGKISIQEFVSAMKAPSAATN